MIKIIFFITLSIFFFSCKKKNCTQEILPDSIIEPSYEISISNNLFINVKGTNKDSILYFGGFINRYYNGLNDSYEPFNSLLYNGQSASNNINTNFLENSNIGYWQTTSTLVGNFNYSDNRLQPTCNDASNLSLNTVTVSSGVSFDLTDFKNADILRIETTCLDYTGGLNNEIKNYDLIGKTSLNVFISDILDSYYTNSNIKITFTFYKTKIETLNGFSAYITKYTTYSYITKKID